MPNFTLRELECFTAAAEELNFTAAARRLNLSQPPLSRHIAALERRLGAALFSRTRRQVRLTPAGERFRVETAGVLAQLERAEAALRTGAWEESGHLRVGFVSALLSPDLMGVFEAFHKAHPEVRVTLQDSPPATQLEQIRDGAIDLGFIGLAPPRTDRMIALWPWRRERLCAFFPASHALRGAGSVPVSKLAGEPLAVVSSAAAPAFAARLREVFESAGIRARRVQEADRAQAVAMMAVGGSAVALLPESVQTLFPGACAVPVVDREGKPVWLEFVLAGSSRPTATMRSFLRCATGKTEEPEG